jgi:hypothetical protein
MTAEPLLTDFPKIECPFVRQRYLVDIQDYKKYGRSMKLREPEVYIVENEINPGYEWVFDDPDTFACEKLDGTNVKIKTEKGRLGAVQNRKNPIDPLQVIHGQRFIIDGVLRAATREWILPDGVQAGEVVGPKLQGNPYQLSDHLWVPFSLIAKQYRYKSFENYDRTFDNWSNWFETHLVSLFYCNQHKVPHKDCTNMAEGVIFYNLKRQQEGKPYMAKLRRDMFRWYYEEKLRILERIPQA